MSRSYRDVMRERGVPSGPWCTDEHGTAIVDRNAQRQDAQRLGPEDESDGAAKTAIARTTNIYNFRKAKNHV